VCPREAVAWARWFAGSIQPGAQPPTSATFPSAHHHSRPSGVNATPPDLPFGAPSWAPLRPRSARRPSRGRDPSPGQIGARRAVAGSTAPPRSRATGAAGRPDNHGDKEGARSGHGESGGNYYASGRPEVRFGVGLRSFGSVRARAAPGPIRAWTGRRVTRPRTRIDDLSPTADDPADVAFNAEEGEVNGGDCRSANAVLTSLNLNVGAADGASRPSGTSQPSAFQLRRSRTRIDDLSPTADCAADAAFNAEEGEVNGGDCRGANSVLTSFNHNVRAADGASEPSGTSQPSAFQLRRSRTRIDDGALPDRRRRCGRRVQHGGRRGLTRRERRAHWFRPQRSRGGRRLRALRLLPALRVPTAPVASSHRRRSAPRPLGRWRLLVAPTRSGGVSVAADHPGDAQPGWSHARRPSVAPPKPNEKRELCLNDSSASR
jgi:hypothetical protein